MAAVKFLRRSAPQTDSAPPEGGSFDLVQDLQAAAASAPPEDAAAVARAVLLKLDILQGRDKKVRWANQTARDLTFAQLLEARARDFPARVAVSQQTEAGWHNVTWADLREQTADFVVAAQHVAGGLALAKGTNVCTHHVGQQGGTHRSMRRGE